MAEYHFPVPGSTEEKKIILFLRRHWASFLGQIILSFFLFFFPIALVLIVYFSDKSVFHGLILNFLVLGLSTYYLVIVTFIFTSLIAFYYDLYIVTDEAIIDVNQQGFFGRKIVQISLLRVQDVTSNIQGLFPTLFAYGNVLIETAGEQTQSLLLEQIPNPQEVASKILELHNELIETEGRHHQILEAEGALAPGTIGEAGHIAGGGHPISESAAQPLSFPPPEEEQKLEPAQPSESGEKARPKAPQETNAEGEIKSEDLDKGGEVDFK